MRVEKHPSPKPNPLLISSFPFTPLSQLLSYSSLSLCSAHDMKYACWLKATRYASLFRGGNSSPDMFCLPGHKSTASGKSNMRQDIMKGNAPKVPRIYKNWCIPSDPQTSKDLGPGVNRNCVLHELLKNTLVHTKAPEERGFFCVPGNKHLDEKFAFWGKKKHQPRNSTP